MQSGGADGGDHVLAAAVLGRFAVEHHNVFAIGCAAHLALMSQQHRFDRFFRDMLEHPAERGLAGRRTPAVGIAAHPEGPALRRGQTAGEAFQILLSAGAARQIGGGGEAQEGEERVATEPPAVIGHLAKPGTQRGEFGHFQGAAHRHLRLDGGQRRLELGGLQVAAGPGGQFPRKEPFGFAVVFVEVAPTAAMALGAAQLRPAAGPIHGALKTIRIDKGLDDEHRVFVARLPVGAEARQHPAQRGGAEIGRRALGQEEKTHVVRHEREAPPPLLIAPADPGIAGPQVQGGRREDEHRHPLALRVGHRVVHLLAHRLNASEVVVLLQKRLRSLPLFGGIEPLNLQRAKQNLPVFGQGLKGAHARQQKSFSSQCSEKSVPLFPIRSLEQLRNARWGVARRVVQASRA